MLSLLPRGIRSKHFEHGQNIFELADGIGINLEQKLNRTEDTRALTRRLQHSLNLHQQQ